MVTSSRRLLGVLSLGFLPLLAACPGDYEGGYEKVGFRERNTLAMADAPDPPPFISGFGAGALVTPVLAAEIAPPGVTQEMVEEGQQLFGTVCTACHGPGGTGTITGPILRDQDWTQIDGGYDEIVALIQTGVPDPLNFPGAMLPMGGGSFSPEQIRSLAAYVFALSRQAPA